MRRVLFGAALVASALLPAAALQARPLSPPTAAPAPQTRPLSPPAAALQARPLSPPTAAPALQPRGGHAFQPAQGDWEGVANGFPASFELRLDTPAPGSAAAPGYAVTDVVVLAPQTCPLSPSRYRESFLDQAPVRVAGNGYFPLRATGLSGGLDGARAANLSTSYHLGSCSGTLSWHMHPATRAAVSDGRWTAHFSPGGDEAFTVRGNGRLATGIKLPATLTKCSGIAGDVDLFIGPSGRARSSQGTMALTVRFAARRAHGSLTAHGCKPIRVTAAASRA